VIDRTESIDGEDSNSTVNESMTSEANKVGGGGNSFDKKVSKNFKKSRKMFFFGSVQVLH
jgi:hypothetical protein